MITDNPHQNGQICNSGTSSFKDFEMGQRIKKVTTHDLFQLKRSNKSYVAKLFKPEFRHNYEIQLNILRSLQHQNIIQLVYYQSSDSETMGLWNCDMLILKFAEHGSLNQYIPLNGKLSEGVARIIFKQMIAGLKYAAEIKPNPIIHPNLLPSSILINSERKVKICGWSKIIQKKDNKQLIKHLLFNCCEILLLMITSYMPFFKKNSASDPLFKFLKPGYMNKFWQTFEKRVVGKYKSFQFSKQVKELIQKVFLYQWTTFEQVEQSSWMKTKDITKQDYNTFLSQLQKQSTSKRNSLLKKQLQKQQKKRQILIQYEESTLRGSSSRSSGQYDFFIQDFYDNFYIKQDVPASQCSELIRLYDDRPNFVIASLKEHLRNFDGSQICMIFGGEFKLASYSIETQESQAYVELKFEQVCCGQEDEKEDIEIKVKSIIKFFKNSNDHLYAEVKVLESNLCQYYASLLMTFIENNIRRLDP